MSAPPREFRKTVAGRDLLLTVGALAGQADASVLARYGDTVVLGTCLMGPARPDRDFMPLLVEYEEKFYAAGKIKGSRFVKREGKPTDAAITTGRLIDRSIRPLFPDRLRSDIHVVATVLSYDDENDAGLVALLACSAALAVSRIPWQGPIGAVRVGRRNGEFVVNPLLDGREESDLDLVVAATKQDAVMLEANAREISEDDLLRALDVGTKAAADLAVFIEGIVSEVGVKKAAGEYVVVPADLAAAVRAKGMRAIEEALEPGGSKLAIQERVDLAAVRLVEEFGDTTEKAQAVKNVCRDLHREVVREWILASGKRVGGRSLKEIRPLSISVGVLPRTHGSALFQRGETQILSVTTLGAPDDVMILDTMTEEDTKKRFFHFYNMPAFSVGEIKPNRGPGRRDIGHGMLAERAVRPLVPGKEAFPYTVMVVSEVLSSNGSSSMASACGASLALMDAGVPIQRHVAGIAMGLVTDATGQGRKPVVLTDIAGMEDDGCDMDFKVAGTRVGVTAVQVDIKVQGLAREIVREALLGAREAKERILDAMEQVLPQARPELSPFAPRIVTLMVKPTKIRDIIGPRGVTINKIIEVTGVDISVEDDGQVSITGTDAQAMTKAVEWVKALTREVGLGEEFTGRVTRLMKFGAFVELFPGTEGLVHISSFGQGFVRAIEDVVAVGDELAVVVKEIDEQGRVNLSLKERPGFPSDQGGASSSGSDMGGGGRRDGASGYERGARPARGGPRGRYGRGGPSRGPRSPQRFGRR